MHDFQLCSKTFAQKYFLTYSFFEIIPFGETNFSFSFASSKMSICICNFAIFSTMIFQISPTIRIQFLSIRDIITPDFFDHVTSNIIGVTWCHVTWCHVIQVIFFSPSYIRMWSGPTNNDVLTNQIWDQSETRFRSTNQNRFPREFCLEDSDHHQKCVFTTSQSTTKIIELANFENHRRYF